MAISALEPNVPLFVTWRMTSTKIAVITISNTTAGPLPKPGTVAVPFTAVLSNVASKTPDARIAPAIWKIQ